MPPALHPGNSYPDRPEASPGLAIRLAFGVYKVVVSPVLHAFSPSQCLYLPTCSEYAYVAMVRFGVVRGSWLALKRFARCHPFAKGGLDPVPERVPKRVSGPVPAPGPERNPEGPDSVSFHTDHLP